MEEKKTRKKEAEKEKRGKHNFRIFPAEAGKVHIMASSVRTLPEECSPLAPPHRIRSTTQTHRRARVGECAHTDSKRPGLTVHLSGCCGKRA